jgi:hypothetical chaperone protein
MFVGLDFGTSNSSVGVFEDNRLQLFKLDSANVNPYVMPSYTYITRDQQIYVGVEAVQKFLEQETGRRPRWERRNLGVLEMTVASDVSDAITYYDDITVEIDVAAQGRLLQSIKTGLRDPKYGGTQVFERYYSIEELIAILLRQLREKCEREIKQPVWQVVIGRPVKYADDEETDVRAQQKMLEAARLAGFKEVVFELEPIGGAYLYHQQTAQREKIMVFDFGGGTLDMTVVEVGGSQPPVTIATHGVLLGGDDLTSALMRKLFRFFGENSRMADGLPFPAYIFSMLYSWQNMVELSRPQFAPIFKSARDGSDPDGIQRLETLINQKLGFQLLRDLDQLKIKLSKDYYAWLDFNRGDLQLKELILRSRFEELIQQDVERVGRAVDELLKKSGLQNNQIQAVLRTGGSSEIPIFINLLADRFGLEKIKNIDPLTTVVGGLAVKGYELSRAA